MTRNSLRAGATIVTALVTFCSSTALAYLLPADAILSSVSKRRAKVGLSSIVVEGTVEVGENAPHAVWEAIAPGKQAHRVEHKLEGATRVVQTVAGRRYSFTLGEKAARPSIVKDDLIVRFLGANAPDPGGNNGIRFVERLGINAEVVSLSRLDRRVVYVIGAKPWETNKPQLWIDKSLRVPVRLIQVDGRGTVIDTRYLGFGSPVTSEWFPRVIERYENGTLVHRAVYDKVDLNLPLEPQLFEAPK